MFGRKLWQTYGKSTHRLYDALIYIGLFCKGTECNNARYLQEFILDIIENNVSRFKNTPIKKEVFNKLQKINKI